MTVLATFNIHHGAPPEGRADIASVARVCRDLEADVLAVQEVDGRKRRSGWRDQRRALAAATGMHAVHAVALRRGPSTYGTLLLTRAEPRAVQFLALPGAGTERRVGVLANVEIGQASASVAAVHLHAERGIAERQLGLALAELSRRPGPHILLGDLNLGPEIVEPILAAHRYSTVASPPTFPAAQPTRRIDWIAARGLRLIAPEVPEVVVSDHRPLRVRVASES